MYQVENLPWRPDLGQRRFGAMHDGSWVVTISTDARPPALNGCFLMSRVMAVLAPCVPPQHGQIFMAIPFATSWPLPMSAQGLPRCRGTSLKCIISWPYTAAYPNRCSMISGFDSYPF